MLFAGKSQQILYKSSKSNSYGCNNECDFRSHIMFLNRTFPWYLGIEKYMLLLHLEQSDLNQERQNPCSLF